MRIRDLDEAIKRIEKLEKEVADLKAENERLKSRSVGGRKKHDAAWMAAFSDFVRDYENGKTIMEIVNEGRISRRTAYRYLAYYRKQQNGEEQ